MQVSGKCFDKDGKELELDCVERIKQAAGEERKLFGLQMKLFHVNIVL